MDELEQWWYEFKLMLVIAGLQNHPHEHTTSAVSFSLGNVLILEERGRPTWAKKMEYIHYNPVAAGLCAFPEEYKYCSAKFYESGIDELEFLTHWMS